MDVEHAVEDFSNYLEVLDDLDPFTLGLTKNKINLFSIFIAYLFFKLFFRMLYGSKVWDETSLLHNLVSVGVGLYDVYHWETHNMTDESTCISLTSRISLPVALQLIHCVTDFIVFFTEMIKEPVFFCHHLVLVITSVILPYCPGCYFVVIAYTLAEAGSASIAIDAEWRKLGKQTRGLTRVVVFGLTRVVNIYLLYRIYLVTPSKVYFTLSTYMNPLDQQGAPHGDGALAQEMMNVNQQATNGLGNEAVEQKIITVNFPICMITSVGGSLMMLVVNGITWFRMYKSYVKRRRKRKQQKLQKLKQK